MVMENKKVMDLRTPNTQNTPSLSGLVDFFGLKMSRKAINIFECTTKIPTFLANFVIFLDKLFTFQDRRVFILCLAC